MQKIACLGPEGSFSHEFVVMNFPEHECVFADDFEDVLLKSIAEGCEAAVIPFLNPSGVQVRPAQKAIAQYAGQLWVTGAFKHNVVHNLVATENCRKIENIVSKEQVFPQCTTWLDDNYPNVNLTYSSSTSSALLELLASPADIQDTTAVICNTFAVKLYGGVIRTANIQNPGNETIFLTLSPIRPAANERLLVTIECPDRDCYDSSVDRFARRGCPMMFSSLVGEFSPTVPTFVEIKVTDGIDAEQIIKFECDASNGVRHYVGTYQGNSSISDCVSSFFR